MVLLLVACVAKDDSNLGEPGDPCGGTGTIHGCAHLTREKDEPQKGATVVATSFSNDPPIDGVTGADGCVTLTDVPAGNYRIYATSPAGDCSSDTIEVSVEFCETAESVSYLEDHCDR